MREQLKALSKETLVYGLGTVVGRFLNFLLVPFYVNVLRSTAEYGISTSLYTYLGFLNVILPLGLEAAYFRYASRAEGQAADAAEARKLFSAPFLAVAAFSGLSAGLLWLLAPALARPVFHDPKLDITPLLPMLTSILRLGAGILLFDALTVLPFAELRLQRKAWLFVGLRLANILATLILNFLFIVRFHWGVEGIFRANLAGSVLVFALLLPLVFSLLEPRADRAVLGKMLPFGLTNVPAYLGAMMVQVIDRPIVQAFLGLGMLGVYQANYRLGFVMMVFVGLFEYAWRPFFMREALKDDAQARKLFARVFTYFMLAALLSFLALSWGLPVAVSTPIFGHRLLKPAYLAGLPVVPVVLLAYVFQGMYTNFIAGIYIKERNKALPAITGLGAAVNVGANLLLVPRMGIMGAALATLFAYMAMAGALYREAQKAYPIPYEWGRLRTLCAVIAGAWGAERLLSAAWAADRPWFLAALRLGLLAAVPPVLAFLGFFSPREMDFLTFRRRPQTGKA
jgi:O-antigen/teichoic acid export membrane protein